MRNRTIAILPRLLLFCCASLLVHREAFSAVNEPGWKPFQPVSRPAVPSIANHGWARNPIDFFVAAEHQARQLAARPAAPKHILLRRVYIDLIGISPTPEEQSAFAADPSADAYEKVVDRLLNDPRYGERWARHWMDIWRYSDWAGWTGGNQIRDSKPHIWRWRDWIIESLNQDRGYDRMLVEMLAADEVAPEDPSALRATGYLVRNFKMLSREQWLEDTVKHTAQAFLGVTIGCAKCHDHAYDPIAQKEYYQMRAIFEPHQVRTDRLPGQIDTAKDGLVRVYDVITNTPTYLFIRGDERQPDTNHVVAPGVPKSVAGPSPWVESDGRLRVQSVSLPKSAAFPDQREFVIRDLITAGDLAIRDSRRRLSELQSSPEAAGEKVLEQEINLAVAVEKQQSLLATLAVERIAKEDSAWKHAAEKAVAAQRKLALSEARLQLHTALIMERQARKKFETAKTEVESIEASTTASNSAIDSSVAQKRKALDTAKKALDTATTKTVEAQKAFANAEAALQAPLSTDYKPRPMETYPASSTGRRLAFARWLTDRQNPLTARVAMNHVWLRHFGRGLVPTPADFGRNGRAPSHPGLLDWLAAEFMDQQWQFKAIHRLILTSSTYRMSSTPSDTNLAIDPDNIYLWRMPSRRMEAEIVRDNLLHAAEDLQPVMGGPDIDHKLGLTSKRRSVYLRIAAEKEVEFLKIFDGPNVTECYQRNPSVVPQQALALANSQLAIAEAKRLARVLENSAHSREFVEKAFHRVLGRPPNASEASLCEQFLDRTNQRENLLLVLFNHNDFVTIR